MHGYVLSWSNITTAGAVLGMVGAVWRITRKLGAWLKSINDLLKALSQHLTQQDSRLDKIEHELQPNSGTSHHDKVLDGLAEVNKRLDRVERRGLRRWWQ